MKSYLKLKAITEPGFHNAGDTLYLSVKPSGSKSWIQRLTIDGERHDMGLGSFKLVTLSEARDKAFENRKAVRQGRNPLAEKRKAKRPSFQKAATQTFETLKPSWRNGKHTKTWMQAMEKYVFPVIGSTRIDQLGREDVLRILTPLWTKRPETARRLRQKMRQTFRWAQAHGYIDNNPAGEMVEGALPKQPAVKQHLRALDYRELGAALDTIKKSKAGLAAKLCFRFLVLTAARSGEARGVRWTEINFTDRFWQIPAERMKANRAHRVPLSDAALESLEKARGLDDGSGLVFPSPTRPGKPLSDMALTKLLRDNGLAEKTTCHGTRSSFRDFCADTGKPREIAEAALAHVVGGVEGAYFRSDLLDRRRLLMEQWADYLSGTGADVVRLRYA